MKRLLSFVVLGGLLAAACSLPLAAQEEGSDRAKLTLDQERVKIKYHEFQNRLMKLAEATAATDPARAELLRKVFAQGQEGQIEDRLAALVAMLKEERLGTATKEQERLRVDLQKLLDVLLAESPNRLANEKQRLKEYLVEVIKLRKRQEEILDQVQRGGNPGQLGNRQEKVADATKTLGDKIAKNEGGDGKSKDGKDGKSADGKNSDGKAGGKDGKGAGKDGKGAEGKEGKGTGKNGKGDGKDGKGAGKDGKSGDSKSGKAGDPKSGDNKSASGKNSKGDPKSGEGKAGKGGDGEGKDGKASKSKSKGGAGGQSDPRKEPEEGGGGESEDGDQPQDRMESVKKRIYEAEKRMREAKQRLEKAEREGAAEAAGKARDELKKIEKDLEELLRQLREEELEKLLAYLELRFKKMLEMQVAVYEGTLRLDRTPQDRREGPFLTQSSRLSRDESLIEIEAEKVYKLLREDGTSAAMTEATTEIMTDIKQVIVFLSQGKTGTTTQGVEEDIIQALEEMIEALKKAQRELSDRKSPPGQPGQPPDPSLIDILAEVKMLKSLQLRVNRRTERYRRELENPEDEIGQATKAEIRKGLEELRDRQDRIFRATRDLATGRAGKQ